MIRQKTRKDYLAPRTMVAEADLEGIICDSLRFKAQVDEIHNINSVKKDDGTTAEPLYFEF